MRLMLSARKDKQCYSCIRSSRRWVALLQDMIPNSSPVPFLIPTGSVAHPLSILLCCCRIKEYITSRNSSWDVESRLLMFLLRHQKLDSLNPAGASSSSALAGICLHIGNEAPNQVLYFSASSMFKKIASRSTGSARRQEVSWYLRLSSRRKKKRCSNRST